MMAKPAQKVHPTERLAAVRDRRRELLEARRALAARPCTAAEACQRVRDVVRRVADQQPVPLATRARWFTAPEPPAAMPQTIGPHASDAWLPAYLAELCGPLLEEALLAAIGKLDLSHGIASDERQAEANRIAGELEMIEREEERLVRSLEALGEDVDRRPDVDTSLVAAPDAELGATP
jgi:hypothetical protein